MSNLREKLQEALKEASRLNYSEVIDCIMDALQALADQEHREEL